MLKRNVDIISFLIRLALPSNWNCFKQLNIFVKDGFRALHENIKLILKPLRMLRKSAYRLVSLEKEEAQNEDLTMFESKKSMKDFVGGIGNFLQNEEYKMKRD